MDAAYNEWVAAIHASSSNAWSGKQVRALSEIAVPESALGASGWLLRADAALMWGRWLLASIVDPAAYVAQDDERHSFAALYAAVSNFVAEESDGLDDDAAKSLARLLAKAAWDEIQFQRSRSRRLLTRQIKDQVWSAAEPEPRCHLCGYLFDNAAKERYFGRPAPTYLPLLVDFTRPRGRNLRDLTAEVDHVRPVAAGGADELDNLRLACGWCNRAKWSLDHLYAAPAWRPAAVRHPRLGFVSVPRPLWVVRFVSAVGRCEHPGCEAGVTSHELFVAPRRSGGALTPTNIAVWCADHDPWSTERFIGADWLGPGE